MKILDDEEALENLRIVLAAAAIMGILANQQRGGDYKQVSTEALRYADSLLGLLKTEVGKQ